MFVRACEAATPPAHEYLNFLQTLPKGYCGEGKGLRRSLCTLLADWQTSSGELVGMHLHFLVELFPCEWSHYGIKLLLVCGLQ